MGSVYKAYADKRSLRAEHLSIDLIKHFPAKVIITIAACSRKARIGNPVILKSGHDLACVQHRDTVYALKLRSYLLLRLMRKLVYFGFNIIYIHF